MHVWSQLLLLCIQLHHLLDLVSRNGSALAVKRPTRLYGSQARQEASVKTLRMLKYYGLLSSHATLYIPIKLCEKRANLKVILIFLSV